MSGPSPAAGPEDFGPGPGPGPGPRPGPGPGPGPAPGRRRLAGWRKSAWIIGISIGVILVGWLGIHLAFDRTPPGDTPLDVLLTQPVLQPSPGGTEIGRKEFVGNAFDWPFTGTAPPYVAITYASTRTVNQNYSYYYGVNGLEPNGPAGLPNPGGAQASLLGGTDSPRTRCLALFDSQPKFDGNQARWDLAAAPAGTVSYVTVYLDDGQ